MGIKWKANGIWPILAVSLLAIGLSVQMAWAAEDVSESATPEKKLPRLVVQTGHIEVVWSIAFFPDGKVLASGGEDKTE